MQTGAAADAPPLAAAINAPATETLP